MEALRSRLKGSKGIQKKYSGETATPTKADLSSSSIAQTFTYLQGLAKGLPNERIGLALTQKISHIVDSVRRKPDG